ncbi:MAG: Endonuclease/exonuclease/phosphatase [Candidatus Saccharibacteria bacterium]|nr:Endonuclease/exonuclease/phosphatase [Candidatus Saccharibacteria bacterium]
MEIKVVCLNLWEGGNLFKGILQFLKEQDADILLLQEVYAGIDPSFPDNYRSMDVLQRELNYPHSDFAAAMLDRMPEGKVEGGNAVLSKFPILARDVVFFNEPYGERDPFDSAQFPTTPRNLQHVQIDAAGTELNVYNTQGVWDLNGDNFSPQRKRMSEMMIQAVAGKPHVILAGDTNARPTNPAMVAVGEHLDNVFGHELATTFNMRRKSDPGYASSVVDMIFVSHDITVTSKSCPDVDISDHLPLVAELAI